MEKKLPLPIMAKKFWSTVCVVYFLLRRGRKLLPHLNVVLKQAKIAGKAALHGVLFHHRRLHRTSPPVHGLHYEFTCSNSPTFFYAHAFNLSNLKSSPLPIHFSLTSSVLRQIRISDSPFLMTDEIEGEDDRIDVAAEEFIIKFYQDLARQNSFAVLENY